MLCRHRQWGAEFSCTSESFSAKENYGSIACCLRMEAREGGTRAGTPAPAPDMHPGWDRSAAVPFASRNQRGGTAPRITRCCLMNHANQPAVSRELHGPGHVTWLTRQRLLAAATVLLLLEAVLLSITIAASHGMFGQGGATTTDFISFYAAGRVTDGG